jgi:hypothetical protein
MKQELTVTLCSITSYKAEERFPMTVVDFVEWLNEMKEEVPQEYRDSVTIDIDLSTGEYETPEMSVYYFRPETDQEEAVREGREAAYQRARAERQEADERAEFERLKRKYNVAG